MKRLLAFFLVSVMTMGLFACGENADGNGDEPTTEAKITGEVYNAGNVSALVPNGWKAFPAADIWSDDLNATDPDQINIVKGGETEFDMLTKPYLQIVHYEPGSMLTPTKDFYEAAEDLTPFTTGELTWEGFRATSMLGSSVILLWTTNAAGHQFQINVFDKTDAVTIDLTDADLLAILESVTNA